MTTRVTLDGVPNGPIPHAEVMAAVAPLLDLLGGVAVKDVLSLTVTPTEVRAKVAVRNRRGRRVLNAWAHVARKVDFPEDDEQ